MIVDAREHLSQICFRIESVQFCRPDQTIEGCGTIPAAIRSRLWNLSARSAVIQKDVQVVMRDQ
jgi:hypothetical protein